MTSMTYRGAQFIYLSKADAKAVLAYLSWVKYMFTKLSTTRTRINVALDDMPDTATNGLLPPLQTPALLGSPTVDRVLQQIEAILWGNAVKPCRTSRNAVGVITNRNELRYVSFSHGVVIALAPSVMRHLHINFPARKFNDLCVTLDRRLPDRCEDYAPGTGAINRLVSYLIGFPSIGWIPPTEHATLTTATTSAVFADILESMVDLTPFRTTQVPLLSRIAGERSMSTNWIMKFLGVAR
jgi:hypothetical protein